MKSSRYSPEQVTSITSATSYVSSPFPEILSRGHTNVYTNVIGIKYCTLNLIVYTSLLTVVTHL